MKPVLKLISILAAFVQSGAAAQAQDEPPRADAFESMSNFLACTGNPYALCYYSGPDDGSPTGDGGTGPALPCIPGDSQGGTTANAECTCYAITEPEQLHDTTYNYVEIGSILNPVVRDATVEACEADGSGCLNLASLLSRRCDMDDPHIAQESYCQFAPVCSYLGDMDGEEGQTLYPYLPDSTLISTFSFEYSQDYDFGTTSCQDTDTNYAGCMTAPCGDADENGMTQCTCPTYDGPYDIGQNNRQCDIRPNVWSAALNNISPDLGLAPAQPE